MRKLPLVALVTVISAFGSTAHANNLSGYSITDNSFAEDYSGYGQYDGRYITYVNVDFHGVAGYGTGGAPAESYNAWSAYNGGDLFVGNESAFAVGSLLQSGPESTYSNYLYTSGYLDGPAVLTNNMYGEYADSLGQSQDLFQFTLDGPTSVSLTVDANSYSGTVRLYNDETGLQYFFDNRYGVRNYAAYLPAGIYDLQTMEYGGTGSYGFQSSSMSVNARFGTADTPGPDSAVVAAVGLVGAIRRRKYKVGP